MVYFLCKAYDSGRQNCCFALSLPVRGAWVEMRNVGGHDESRSRSPCGERGLKLRFRMLYRNLMMSLPVRGAWVEIATLWDTLGVWDVAPRAGSVG